MKTKLSDYLISAVVITVIFISSLLCVKYLLSGLTGNVFGDYHVIIDTLMFLLFYGLISSVVLRLLMLIKPFTPGNYSMDHVIFTYWKLFTVIYEFGRGALLPFTTVFAKPVVAMLFGAKIGKDIALGGHLVDPQLISIGDEAIIGQDSVITAHTINSGSISLQQVKIGARATIGVNVVIMSGVEIGEDSIIAAASVVVPETHIPSGEMWGGTPAKKIKNIN